jgi:hypothetical protein
MSGFLANLARRAAGLPPVTQDAAALVGARGSELGAGNLETAVPVPADTGNENADAAQSHAQVDSVPVASVPLPRAAAVPPAPQPAVPIVMAQDSRAASPSPAVSVTSVTAPVLQRFVMPSSPAPLSPASSPPAASPSAGPVQPAAMMPAPPAPPDAPPIQPREDTRGLLRFPFPMPRAAEEPVAIAQPAPAARPTVDVERVAAPLVEPAHTTERLVMETRLVEPMRSASPPVPARSRDAGLLPSSAAAPAVAPARDAEAPAERVVQVRIGAIEIHGAEPPPSAAPASPLSATAPPLLAAGDFDRFTALRSYAAWEW